MKTLFKELYQQSLSQKTRDSIRSVLINLRRKYLVFIFFVFLSTIAWFIRALSDTYVTELSYPVRYNNLPPNRILSEEPPKRLNLTIRSDGYTILYTIISYKFRLKRPLRFDINRFTLYSLSFDSTSVYTLTNNTFDRLSTELNEGSRNVQLLDIEPDTIFFNFSRVKRKKVPVIANYIVNENFFSRQYMFNGEPYVIPDSVEITGPQSVIDTVTSLETMPVTFENLDDTTSKNVYLKKPSNKITFSIKKVKLIVPVDRFTEANFEIPVATNYVPDSLLLKIFPKNIRVTYLITISNFDKMKTESFKPYVDYRSIETNAGASKLQIQMNTLPSFVHGVKISPTSVEFLIEKQIANNRNNGRHR